MKNELRNILYIFLKHKTIEPNQTRADRLWLYPLPFLLI